MSGLCGQTPDPQPPGPPPDPQRPPLTPLPAEGNWIFLQDPAKRVDFWDRVKYIPLNRSGDIFLSIGGEYRGEYERSDSTLWGSGPQDSNGYYLQRLLPHFDLRVGEGARLYVELQFDDVFGRNGGPRPGIDRDRAAVHQTFAEFGGNRNRKDGVRLRVGRQELAFGTGRLVDNNEGVNVKFSFDGARLTLAKRDWKVDLFAVKPVQINPGVFDDSPDFRRSFWGVYGTVPMPVQGMKADLYYLGLDTKNARYQAGMGSESRQSFGVRLFNRKPGALPEPGLDYNWEAVYQGGSFHRAGIRAWTTATETGYAFRTRLPFRIALRADAASGDHSPSDCILGTFNPLFPRGAYFGPKFVLIAPYNLYDLHPFVFLRLRQNITASVEWVWLWRQSIRDGVYGFGGALLRPGTGSRARFIGSQANFELRWALTPHVTLAVNPSGFLTGEFLKETPPSENIAFLNIGLVYRF